ncbi:tetratricopeptide repeat protein [Bdellovibrio sp. HCB209]|uniref:tetratricopeptide repeat protein n=1 Tax=Bdellovibrio sp. HCB209 TaxID=3394354 RepID=UPI0039B37DF6
MSTKFTKEELKSPDQVTKTLREGFVWTTTHSQIVITAVIAFIVVGAGASLMNYFSTKKENAEQAKYFVLEKAYTEKKRGFEEVARAEATAANAKDKKTAPAVDLSKKASGDVQKDFGSVITGFEAMINEAPKTTASQMAALNLSDIFVSYKKYDEAMAALTKVEAGLNKSDLTSGLVWMQMGNVLADKGDCKAAIDKWAVIVGSKAFSFAHDEAKLRQGLCYESLNDTAKAEALYTEVSNPAADPQTMDSVSSREAAKYLRLLKAKKNL